MEIIHVNKVMTAQLQPECKVISSPLEGRQGQNNAAAKNAKEGPVLYERYYRQHMPTIKRIQSRRCEQRRCVPFEKADVFVKSSAMASTPVQTLKFTLKRQVGRSKFPHAHEEVDGTAQEEGNLQMRAKGPKLCTYQYLSYYSLYQLS